MLKCELSGEVYEQQPVEEALRSSTIALCLQIHINYFPILIHCPPQAVPLATNLDEHFIDKECIAVASMPSLPPPGVVSSELSSVALVGYSFEAQLQHLVWCGEGIEHLHFQLFQAVRPLQFCNLYPMLATGRHGEAVAAVGQHPA